MNGLPYSVSYLEHILLFFVTFFRLACLWVFFLSITFLGCGFFCFFFLLFSSCLILLQAWYFVPSLVWNSALASWFCLAWAVGFVSLFPFGCCCLLALCFAWSDLWACFFWVASALLFGPSV